MWYVGQRVVCVADGPCCCCQTPTPVRNGCVYVVRQVVTYIGPDVPPANVRHGDLVIHLFDAPSRVGIHWGYATSRFRPAVDRKTDISVFKEILDREPPLEDLLRYVEDDELHEAEAVDGRKR